ncbi:phenylacetate--CoA ligase family protein [Usitatibacter rugosus]|uniref:phenylacetate--CoA ligase family protein n=1 Tax=Usitatibacter rugosus TaxID=2732067 RepID=UPI001BB29A50|nr:AMP-binding protein [Usitatibacter rugosus]
MTRKSELVEQQKRERPFGGLNATKPGGLARIFMSPGPIYDPEGRGVDYWHTARSLFAAGFRAGDVAINCFSYHLSPAASMFETGLHKLECAVIPGGVGQTELQCRAIADLQPSGYVGTPSFLKILIEKADELSLDVSSIKRAVVSGEAFLPPVKEFLRARGIAAFQAYGTADLGIVAYESPAHEGLVCEEEIVVEIVRPGTGDPVPDGEVGEVVVTSFSPDYPLIRFATGDLSAVLAGASPCGRTNLRIKGWMGRADQTTKVRGLFVHPHQVAEVLKRHALGKARLTVENEGGEDRMTLSVERAADAGVATAVEASLKEITKLRGEVKFAAAGSLPNDGKVIEDLRKY